MKPSNYLLIITLILMTLNASAQEQTSEPDTLRKDALNVYMEASDYIRKEIPYINYVRDLKDADVYIMTSYRSTGSGGTEHNYFLVGQKKFAGMQDTIAVISNPDETQDAIREKEVKALKLALVRYIRETPLAEYIDIRFSMPIGETVSDDRWNSWVFRASVSGYFSGQKTYQSSNLNFNASAGRVTEKIKTEISAGFNQNNDKYQIEDESITNLTSSAYLDFLNVWAINDHWSYGGSSTMGKSVYDNFDFSFSLYPAIEYDIYPYSESTTRQLRLMYRIGLEYANYQDTTWYNMTEELLFAQKASAAYEVIQKWGSANFSLSWSNYLHDFSLNNLALSGSMNIRVAKGLSVNFGGSISAIHDQLSLRKEGASTEDILLQRRAMETSFRYFTHFGLSYTFGSIYNNVVNPRFGGGGHGGGMIIMY